MVAPADFVEWTILWPCGLRQTGENVFLAVSSLNGGMPHCNSPTCSEIRASPLRGRRVIRLRSGLSSYPAPVVDASSHQAGPVIRPMHRGVFSTNRDCKLPIDHSPGGSAAVRARKGFYSRQKLLWNPEGQFTNCSSKHGIRHERSHP